MGIIPSFKSPIPWAYILTPLVGVMMVAVFMKGKKVTKIREFDTSQGTNELLDRSASAIKEHTGMNVNTNYMEKSNSWFGGSIFFFTKNEFDKDDL